MCNQTMTHSEQMQTFRAMSPLMHFLILHCGYFLQFSIVISFYLSFTFLSICLSLYQFAYHLSFLLQYRSSLTIFILSILSFLCLCALAQCIFPCTSYSQYKYQQTYMYFPQLVINYESHLFYFSSSCLNSMS